MKICSPFLYNDEGIEVKSPSHLWVLNNLSDIPSSDYSIREFRWEEVEDIKRLDYEIFRLSPYYYYFSRTDPCEKCFVCALNGSSVILGYIKFNIKEDLKRHYGRVEAIAVIPALRGRGIGTMLMQHMENYLKNCEFDIHCIKLKTPDYNQPALRFYYKEGYQLLRVCDGYYHLLGQIHNAISLEKKLK